MTRVGSSTTSAFGTSVAASAWCAVRKPRTARGLPRHSERYGNGATPMPPPTRSGRATERSKPLPSGPVTRIASPGSSDAMARVPAPTGSTRNPSSPRGARHRLNGRGSTRPGASSMKNWPGAPGLEPAAADAYERVRADGLVPPHRRAAPCAPRQPRSRWSHTSVVTRRPRCAPAGTGSLPRSRSRSRGRPRRPRRSS